jgi:hypothetical protein
MPYMVLLKNNDARYGYQNGVLRKSCVNGDDQECSYMVVDAKQAIFKNGNYPVLFVCCFIRDVKNV